MSNFKPIDGKRDDFRKYLERTGVLEAISKVFIKLIHCTERPDNAIEYICENLGHTLYQNDVIENLKRELEESNNEIVQLKSIIESITKRKNNDDALNTTSQSDSDPNDDNKPSSTTETIKNVTDIEFLMKNIENSISINDENEVSSLSTCPEVVTETIEKKSEVDEKLIETNIPVSTDDTKNEVEVTEEIK